MCDSETRILNIVLIFTILQVINNVFLRLSIVFIYMFSLFMEIDKYTPKMTSNTPTISHTDEVQKPLFEVHLSIPLSIYLVSS